MNKYVIIHSYLNSKGLLLFKVKKIDTFNFNKSEYHFGSLENCYHYYYKVHGQNDLWIRIIKIDNFNKLLKEKNSEIIFEINTELKLLLDIENI